MGRMILDRTNIGVWSGQCCDRKLVVKRRIIEGDAKRVRQISRIPGIEELLVPKRIRLRSRRTVTSGLRRLFGLRTRRVELGKLWER